MAADPLMQSSVIIGTIRILPRRGRRADVLEILRSAQGKVLAQPGCMACDIYEEQGPDRAVVLLERFDSEGAFLAHLGSEAFGRVLGAIELSRDRPGIQLERVAAGQRLEWVEPRWLSIGASYAKRRES